jgi:quinol monooxygenase YgiN
VSEVVVVAVVRALPGNEERVLELYRGLLEPTHLEDGCLLYALHRDRADPGRLVFVERWASADALTRHACSAHIARVSEEAAPLLQGPVEVMVLDPVPGGDPAFGLL